MDILFNNKIDTIILDLDGVVTDTASLHEQAWKQTFTAFLTDFSKRANQQFQSFTHDDYLEYLDGKPRLQGAQDFLHSRNIDLPEGFDDDPPGFLTVGSIANQKNHLYYQFIDTQGVSAFPDTKIMLIKWRLQGYKLALISSSKSCRYIIDRAGLSGAFDAIVDGNDLVTMKLKGKPDPDMFLYTTEKIGSTYNHTAIIEDAVSGIEAGKRGNFAAIIGVARNDHPQLLLKHGADKVVFTLTELSPQPQIRYIKEVPSFTNTIDEFLKTHSVNKFSIFLDYDGTLTPIVSRPEEAIISRQTKNILRKLSQKCTVAIISGRDRQEIQSLIDIDSLYYAGNHGFDIAGPQNCSYIHPSVKIIQTYLSRAELLISDSLSSIRGILIERKRFSIAVHYRQVNPDSVETIRNELNRICSAVNGLKVTSGKKVFELQPDIEWNKGTAVLWLIEKLLPIASLTPERTILYIGDDLTDEDAFREIADIGISVLVGSHDTVTAAKYHLNNVDQVIDFIETLVIRAG
jgi:alpha,alpha-trehalase